MTFTHGDPIWFRQTCRGGYGWERDVPGLFWERTAKRITVCLTKKDGTHAYVSVHPKNVRPRVEVKPPQMVTPQPIP